MNAPTTLAVPDAMADGDARDRTIRHDGWTADRRGRFLEAIADGHTVEAACRHVGLSPAAAYALRRREAGFARGWAAAALLARDVLADVLTSRAIDGQVDTYTRADGIEVTRHRYDNRLGQAMLARLDRLATEAAAAAPDAPAPRVAEPAGAAEARAIAGDFEAYVTLVADDAAPDALADFARARTAGTSQLPQLRTVQKGREWLADDPELAADVTLEPFWWDEDDEQLLTDWPPPPGFAGTHYGTYGFANYARTLTPDEQAMMDAIAADNPAIGDDEDEDEDEV